MQHNEEDQFLLLKHSPVVFMGTQQKEIVQTEGVVIITIRTGTLLLSG